MKPQTKISKDVRKTYTSGESCRTPSLSYPWTGDEVVVLLYFYILVAFEKNDSEKSSTLDM